MRSAVRGTTSRSAIMIVFWIFGWSTFSVASEPARPVVRPSPHVSQPPTSKPKPQPTPVVKPSSKPTAKPTTHPSTTPLSTADTPVDFPSINDEAKNFTNPDAHLTAIFKNAILDTTKQAFMDDDGTAYVKTGDIPAEWFRDSSAQVRPYISFAKKDPAVAKFLRGMIARQGKYLAIDPYANAFRSNYTVWEEKFELDSLAYPIMLAWTYWKATGDTSIFTPDYAKALGAALDTMLAEQDHPNAPRHYTHAELSNNPVGHTGMIWTGFRPSDDACVYNFLIPSEMMAVVALGELAEIFHDRYHDEKRNLQAIKLRLEVNDGIQKFGLIHTPKHGTVYAYEVDGMGNANLMDDANIPSLLSAPYLGYLRTDDPIYQNTRAMLLSTDNPYFYSGKLVHGEGSPHTPDGYVWPLALLAQGLTSSSADEQREVLAELLASDPGDNLLHESFNPNDPTHFTRKDFGWPNSLFAEYILGLNGVQLPKSDARDLFLWTR